MSGQFGRQFYDLVFKLSQEQQAEFNTDFGIKGPNQSAERSLITKREKRFSQNKN